MTLLFLNSIGGFEVIFILLAVLILFGANSIPSIARTLGKGMREIKTASDEIKRDIQNSTIEMRRDLNVKNPLSEMKDLIEKDNQTAKTPDSFKPDNPETTLDAPEGAQAIKPNWSTESESSLNQLTKNDNEQTQPDQEVKQTPPTPPEKNDDRS